MKEEIRSIIDENLDNIKPTLEDIYSEETNIDELVENQNEKAYEEQEYKKDLIKAIEHLKEEGFDITYNNNQTIEELENIINNANN